MRRGFEVNRRDFGKSVLEILTPDQEERRVIALRRINAIRSEIAAGMADEGLPKLAYENVAELCEVNIDAVACFGLMKPQGDSSDWNIAEEAIKSKENAVLHWEELSNRLREGYYTARHVIKTVFQYCHEEMEKIEGGSI
jgi:hypothetical protein